MSQLLPGNTIGIIGGIEQVGAVAIAAKQHGYRVQVYRQADEFAVFAADREVVNSYQNRAALYEFANGVDTILVLTNLVDVDILVALSSRTRYYQSFELAEIAQNGVVEKIFLEEHAINVAPYGVVTHLGELPGTLSSIGFPALLEANKVTTRQHERIMLYDQEIDEHVASLLDEGDCLVTAFVPAQRHFSVTIVRDYEDQVTILPITEDIYVGDVLKYSIASKRMNPDWVGELRTIASKLMRSVSGATVVAFQVVLAGNGIFYVTKVNQLPLVQHHFSERQVPQAMSEVMMRLATGLPILQSGLYEEAVIVPVYASLLEKAQLLTVLKPAWEFEYFSSEALHDRDVLGVIRLTGESSVDLVNELELSGLHDGFSTTKKKEEDE